MKTRILGLIAFGTVWLISEARASSIQDPIEDYLRMQVPARSDYVGTLEFVKRVKLDVDGDGNDEVFIGTPYRYSGAKYDFNWAGYIPVEGGFQRITPSDEDFPMDTFEDIYIGPLTEISKQGLATADDVEVDNPESGNIIKVGMLRFLYIANGRLIQEEWGPLDLAAPEQKTAYRRYFGADRVTRKAIIESFSRQQLQEMGYTIPDWEPSSP